MMAATRFEKRWAPLHLRSDHTLYQSLNTPVDLLEFGKTQRFQSMALTDRGNLFAALKFYQHAVDRAGIKPVIGMEVPVLDGDSPGHLYPVLLAMDSVGYRRLVSLSSRLNDGLRDALAVEDLLEETQGLAMLCGGCGGILDSPFRDPASREELAGQLKEVWGDRFHLEVHYHGLEEERDYNRFALELAPRFSIPLVATDPGGFVHDDQTRAYEALQSLGPGQAQIRTGKIWRLRTAEEMCRLFRERPEALTAAYELSLKLNLELRFDGICLPSYPVPAEYSEELFLRKLVRERLPPASRSGVDPYQERADAELAVIEEKKLSGYFLVIWDLVRQARTNQWMTGPGRGSACGSLVAYLLGITEIDPLEYQLPFERFLNPERQGLPDIDVDVSHLHRGDLLKWLAQRHPEQTAVQIVAFGTFRPRASLRDAARFCGLDSRDRDLDTLVKKIGDTDDQLLRLGGGGKSSHLDRLVTPRLEETVSIARKLLGRMRSVSIHAAGTVLVPKERQPWLPLIQRDDTPLPLAAFDMKDLDRMGLVKLDILSLTTLTVVADALFRSRRRITFRELDLHDAGVYKEISRGNTWGIFQLESTGMREFFRRLQPTGFAELIDGLALYRPGPMGAGMVDSYLEHKPMDVPPAAAKALASTRGVLVYQEQVMEIARRVAGYSMAKADLLREAMTKKRHRQMEQSRDGFVAGAVENGLSEEEAERIFELLAKFGEYGFNRSHAAAYAQLAYLTMYLKLRYPAHFIAAQLTFGSERKDRKDTLEIAVEEAMRLGVRLAHPSIHGSLRDYQSGRHTLAFPLSSIRGILEIHLQAIDTLRRQHGKFPSLEEFLAAARGVDRLRPLIPILAKAGALDDFGYTRRGLLMAIDGESLETARRADEFDEELLRSDERELLGIYIPASREDIGPSLRTALGIQPLPALESLPEGRLAVAIAHCRGRSGGRLELRSGNEQVVLDATELPSATRRGLQLLQIIGGAKSSRVIAARPFEEAHHQCVVHLQVAAQAGDDTPEMLQTLFHVLRHHEGSCPLYLSIREAGQAGQVIRTALKVRVDETMVDQLEAFSDRLTVCIDPFPTENPA